MKKGLTSRIVQWGGVMLLGIAMASCSQQTNNPLPWNRTEVEAVFDLTELGEPGFDQEGNWTLGGRLLDPTLITTQTYGRTVNLLGLEDAAYNALSPDVANAIFFAKPDQIREAMRQYGINMTDVRSMQADGSISAAEFKLTAQRVAERSGSTKLMRQLGLEGGKQ
jgi:hypothetical protein